MTDYIAFINNEPISIYDYKDGITNNLINKNDKIYCICGEAVYFKNESKYFKRKNSNCLIQTICHFSHYKNSKCNINKIFKINNNFGTPISPAPNKTDLEKRIERINSIIDGYFNSSKIQENLRYTIGILTKTIKINNLNIILSDDIIELQNNYYEQITFRALEFIEINHKIRYKLIDLNYKERNRGITYNLYNHICNDYERYKIYVKKLSLIILYYSRCINYNYKNNIDLIINDIINKLEEKKLLDIDNPITNKYIHIMKQLL